MRIKVSNSKRLSGLILLFASVGLLTMIQSADAMDTPDLTFDPFFPVLGSDVDLIWTGNIAPQPPHEINNIRVVPPSSSGITNTFTAAQVGPNTGTDAAQGDCSLGSQELRAPTAGDTGHVFELQEVGGTAISFLIAATGHTITVPFPNGPGGTVSITAVGAGTSSSAGTAKWVDITETLTPIVASLDEVGFYSVDSCGIDGPTTTTPWKIQQALETKPAVGGALLAIDTTSLLIAGATANALWILPVLGLAAVGSIALLKFQVGRRA